MSDKDSDDIDKARPSGNAGRCVKKHSRRVYSKRRKFAGNQFTKNKNKNGRKEQRKSVVSSDAREATISGKKVVDISVPNPKPNEDIQGYRLIDMSILDGIVCKLLCPVCHDFGLNIYEDGSKRRGMSSLIYVKCTICHSYYDENFTSKPVKHVSSTQGRTTYDINIRTVYAMRRCGVGRHGMTKFCGLLNMPPPITQHSYVIITKKLGVAAENIAKSSMYRTIEDVKATEGTVMTVSVDGTWQRRGFSSLNGVVAAVSVNTGNVVDIEIMSRNCKACESHENMRISNPVDYDLWKNSHEKDCQYNNNMI